LINDLLLKSATVMKLEDGRKIRADSTVMETNIHAPADSALLFDCVVVLSRLLRKARRKKASIEFQDHRRRARYRRVGIENARTREDRFVLYKDLLKVTRKTLRYAETAVAELEALGTNAGLVLDCLVGDGSPADSSLTKELVERQVSLYGRAPEKAAFDGGFASRENLEELKKLGVRDVVFSKGRGLSVSEMTGSTWLYRRLRNFRAGVESIISFLKRSFGMRRCTWRSLESFKAYTWASIISANLVLIARASFA
jgi:IS5 family transposase